MRLKKLLINFIIENFIDSAYCIGYCTRSTGGTAYTLRYAKAQGLTVWNATQNGKKQ